MFAQGKEILSIFKDAKDVYKERKNELKQTYMQGLDGKPPQKLLENVKAGDTASMASGRSARSRASTASTAKAGPSRGRPALTAEALSQIDEGRVSDATSESSREASDPLRPKISRRHTTLPTSEAVNNEEPKIRPRASPRSTGLNASEMAENEEPRPRLSRRSTGMDSSQVAESEARRPGLSRRHTGMNPSEVGSEAPRPGLSRRHTGFNQSEVTSLPPYKEESERSSRRPRLGGRAGSVFGGSQAASALSRRHTDQSVVAKHHTHPPTYSSLSRSGLLNRSNSVPDFHGENIDMNLAYGDMPGPSKKPQELELRSKMSKVEHLLMEANCLQGTATAIIKKLHSNPEAMAAVALTLAQISSMLKNFNPSMMQGLKVASPATFALLASPEFLIAGGVAAGITVVAFGGYKIMKKMSEQKAALQAGPAQEAIQYEPALSSIESWRRGISVAGSDIDDDCSTLLSVGTSVEGDIVTPEAHKQRIERRRERSQARSTMSSKSRPGMSRKGTSNRSLVPSERSISYRSEKNDDENDEGRTLGKELMVRPKAERSSSGRSSRSNISMSRSEMEDNEENEGERKELKAHKKKHRKERKEEDAESRLGTESVVSEATTIKEKKKHRKERREDGEEEKEPREKVSKREALANLLSKSSVSEKVTTKSEKTEKSGHRRPKMLEF